MSKREKYRIRYKVPRWIGLLFLGILIFPLFSYGQGVNTIESKFENFRKKDLHEKLFVHIDKNFFVAGEIVWFKIYDINGANNNPFNFSKVAYVELLDNKHQPVLQVKVSLSGDGSGSLKLPYSIPSGNYLFRAYTSWMKNFSPDYFFKEIITVVNTTQKGGGIAQKEETKYDVQFLPEGGNLVAGLKSEVGFRAVNQDGEGLNFRGVLIDKNNDTLLSFRPFRFGMGHFYFTPAEGGNYKAVLHLDNGKTIVKDLPKIYSQGYVMHIQKEDNGKIQVTVHCNIPSANQAYLIVHTRGLVNAAQALPFKNGLVQTVVDQNDLGEGISQFTLFDDALQPVCERLFFRKVTDKLNIDVKSDMHEYGLRKKITLSFYTKNAQNNPIPADLSVSVYRLDSLNRIDQTNILNYLWLISDLKGNIQDPEYYFSKDGGVEEASENLMLTQGWRGFDWKNAMQDKAPAIQYPAELSGLVVSGNVSNAFNKPAGNVITYFSIPGKYVHVYASQSDDKGNIYFKPKDFYGDNKIVIETNTQSADSANKINIGNPFSENYSKQFIPEYNFDKNYEGQLQSYSLWSQVQQAYHSKELNKFIDDPVDTVAFFGKPFKVYNLDDYVRYTTMEEVIREYVTEVALRRNADHYRLMVLNAIFNNNNSSASVLFQDNPFILLDGVPVFNVDSVIALNPLKIQKLAVVAGRYFWGPIVADGIVSFTSYKGDMAGFNLNPHAVILNYKGLEKQRKFYSPVYKTENASADRIPDFRNVLYWTPQLISDNEGMAECSFYTSDLSGKYLVMVNGISNNGKAGSIFTHFMVIGH